MMDTDATVDSHASRLAKLSDDELRVKVAELCGWTCIREQDYYMGHLGRDEDIRQFWEGVSPYQEKMEIPNYPADLNAMHEAEKRVTSSYELCEAYQRTLAKVAGAEIYSAQNQFLFHATAAQRAEAFVLTLDQSPDVASSRGPSVSKQK